MQLLRQYSCAKKLQTVTRQNTFVQKGFEKNVDEIDTWGRCYKHSWTPSLGGYMSKS